MNRRMNSRQSRNVKSKDSTRKPLNIKNSILQHIPVLFPFSSLVNLMLRHRLDLISPCKALSTLFFLGLVIITGTHEDRPDIHRVETLVVTVIALTGVVKVVREAMAMSPICNMDGAKHMVQMGCQSQAHEVVILVVMMVPEITSKVVRMMGPVLAEDQT